MGVPRWNYIGKTNNIGKIFCMDTSLEYFATLQKKCLRVTNHILDSSLYKKNLEMIQYSENPNYYFLFKQSVEFKNFSCALCAILLNYFETDGSSTIVLNSRPTLILGSQRLPMPNKSVPMVVLGPRGIAYQALPSL